MQIPSTRPAARGAQSFSRNFLSDVVIDYGPRDVLNRLFLKADTELREQGVELSFVPVEMMVEVNRLNRESWLALFPIVDARLGAFNDQNGFCIVGRNASGEVVTAQAVRLYEFGRGSFKEEAESLRLWYSNPERMKAAGEACRVTCPSAAALQGRAVFSGGVWYHPDYRRLGLTTIIGRVVKAYAYTRWFPDTTFTLMLESVLAGGTGRRAGYTHSELAVDVDNLPGLGSIRLALLWLSAEEHGAYFSDYLAARDAQIDTVVLNRTA